MKYIDYVNIKQGTKSSKRYSNGNTLPLTQLPFGMGGYCPQTNSDGGNWFYHPDDRSVEGIRLTHQASPHIGDFGCITFMPQEGNPYFNAHQRWSGYKPEEADLRPDYLRVNFLRYNSTLELSPTERGAAIRLTFNGNLLPRFAILPVSGESHFKIDKKTNRIYGYTTSTIRNIAVDFKMFFVFEFDCKIDMENTVINYENGEILNGNSITGIGAGINIALTKRNVEIKFCSSYINMDQALLNLDRELSDLNFDQTRTLANKKWENMLSKVIVECDNDYQMRTFYSCFARVFLYPNITFELDKYNNPIHYCPHNGEIAKGITYTNNGFWDTFRTIYPLLSIIAPEIYAEILEGFINIYIDCGWLPKWTVMGEFGLMPGTYIDAVIADAAVKGIISGDLLKKAFEGMIKHANIKADDERYGRRGVLEYNKYNYVPNEFHESVNHSLDSYYGDFCIAQVAKILGETYIYEKYMMRSKNYEMLFDKSTGFMRGRNKSGEMKKDFSPFDWGGEYTEASAFQTSFAVNHDFDGLANLHGGREKIINKLDELFNTSPLYNVGGYGFEIHEMTEMAAVNFGQCAISNQPSMHIPYLYSYFGKPEKTEYWVEKICRELFSYKDDGFPGDEDNGTMAAWYIFSSLGLYPICPGKPEYVKGKMLVKNVKINGNNFDLDNFGRIIKHDEINQIENVKDIKLERLYEVVR